MDNDQLLADIKETGLDRIGPSILSLSRSCVLLEAQQAENMPIAVTRIGGLPDVPAGFVWPRWNEQPLSFLAQLNLRAFTKTLVANEVPDYGLLSFFYAPAQSAWGFDPKDKGASQVFWIKEPATTLSRAMPPKDLLKDGIYRQSSATLAENVSLPDFQSPLVDPLEMTEQEEEKYCSLLDKLRTGAPSRHQLLGYSETIQGDMQLECQLASNGVYCGNADGYKSSRAAELKPGANDWRLLFQLDSDDESGMMWGDGGMLYFWIKQQDLSERRFENSWMILQCC